MITYCKRTLRIIKRKIWLIALPIFLAIVAYSVKLLFRLGLIIAKGQLEQWYYYFNKYRLRLIIPSIQELVWIIKGKFWTILMLIPSQINFISYGNIVNNYQTFAAFLVVALFLFLFIIYRLKKAGIEADNKTFQEFKLLGVLFFSFGMVAAIVYCFLFWIVLDSNNIFFILQLRLIELIFGIMVLSLLEVNILLAIREVFYYEDLSLEWKAKQFLAKFIPILKLNAILGLFLASQNYLIISSMDGKFTILDKNIFIVVAWQLINLVVFILTIFAPQFIVFRNKSVSESIKASIKFIKFNFKQFVLLLVIFTCFLFIGGVVARVFNAGTLTFIYALFPKLLYTLVTVFCSIMFSLLFLLEDIEDGY